jgi:transposase
MRKEIAMVDRKIEAATHAIEQITPELKAALNEAKDKLKSSDRRQFMAQIVVSLGPGGQRRAQRELGWNRNTIIKGTKELNSGIVCIDNFSGRGRRRSEHHLPNLLDDIKAIVEPLSQVDPTFRTDQCYCPLTAGEVRRRLIEEKHYSENLLPKERTIRSKLNQLGFKPQKVAKSKPKKKSNR